MSHVFKFLKTFCFEVIVDSHAGVRSNTKRSCVLTLYPVFPSGYVLQNYSAVTQPGY